MNAWMVQKTDVVTRLQMLLATMMELTMRPELHILIQGATRGTGPLPSGKVAFPPPPQACQIDNFIIDFVECFNCVVILDGVLG